MADKRALLAGNVGIATLDGDRRRDNRGTSIAIRRQHNVVELCLSESRYRLKTVVEARKRKKMITNWFTNYCFDDLLMNEVFPKHTACGMEQ